MEAAFLSFKMGYLEEQRTELHNLVDKQVDKVLHMGKTWLEEAQGNADSSVQSFTQISHLIENAAIFVTQKCKEVSDSKAVMAVEQAVSTFSSKTEKTSTKQVDESKFEEDILSRLSEMDEKRNRSQKELEDKLSSLQMEQVKRLESTESQLQALENELSETKALLHCEPEEKGKQEEGKKKLEICLQNLEKAVEKSEFEMKKLNSHVGYVESCCNYDKQLEALAQRMEKVETNSQHFEAVFQKVKKLEAMGKKMDKFEMLEQKTEKLQDLELRMKEVETTCKKMGKLKTMEQRIKSLESTGHKFEELDAATQSITTRMNECDSALQELATSTEANAQNLKECLASRERGQQKLIEIQGGLNVVEKHSQEVVNTLEGKLDDVEMQYKMVCRIVDERLTPLEQLRGIFNKKIKNRDENIKKLNEIVQKMSLVEPKLSRQEIMDMIGELKVGDQVRRGPDWRWENQDGPSPSLGRIIGFGDIDGWAIVQWDTLKFYRYRVGYRGMCDLAFGNLQCCFTSAGNENGDLPADRTKEEKLNKEVTHKEWASMLTAGTRVRKRMKPGDQGCQGLGTVITYFGDGSISVRWDNEPFMTSPHRMGCCGEFHLALA